MVRFGRQIIFVLLCVIWVGAVFLGNPGPPAPGREDPDLRPWPDGSVLRFLLDCTALYFKLPAASSAQIKATIFRGGATGMAVIALVCWGLSIRRSGPDVGRLPPGRPGRRPAEKVSETPACPGPNGISLAEREELLDAACPRQAGDAARAAGRSAGELFGRPISWRRPGLLGAGLLLLVGWVGWTAAAAGWSHAPSQAFSAFVQFAFVAVSAVVVGFSLDRRLVGRAGGFFLALSAALAVIGLWYHMKRAPARPLTLFVGDSKELAGIFLPALVLSVVLSAGRLGGLILPAARRRRSGADKAKGRQVLRLVVLSAVAAVCGAAIAHCSIGACQTAVVAGSVGVAVSGLVVSRGWSRAAVLVGGVLLVVGGWRLACRADPGPPGPASSPAALTAAVPACRDEPRVDRDRWAFGWGLFTRRPVVGHGGWGYVLLADQLARRKALSDPGWSGRPVGRAESFWLEQLTDFGLVGLVLLGGAVVLLVGSTVQAARTGIRRDHRWLVAGLAGGLAALAVHGLFASSAARPAFAAVLAGWAGLTAAAVRWADRPIPPGEDEYRIGFYPGGLMFLTGAGVVLAAIGYVVVGDWVAGRNLYRAVHEDIPQARRLQAEVLDQERRLLAADPRSGQRRHLAAVLAQKASRRDELELIVRSRLAHASRWSIDHQQRLAATWQQSHWAVTRIEHRIAEAVLLAAHQPSSVGVMESGAWTDALTNEVLLEHRELERIHPGNEWALAELSAQACLLMVRGRYLAYLGVVRGPEGPARSRVVLDAMVEAVGDAARILNDRLANNPADLECALMREWLADRHALAARLGLPVPLAAWLINRADLRITPERRLRLIRDGLRDEGLAQVGSALTPRRNPALFEALGRALRDRSLASPEDLMLPAAIELERSAAGDWPFSPDPDVRNAPQTFRLLAELALLDNHVARRAGLDPPSAGADETGLAKADGWLARAQELYAQAGKPYATQRLVVALQRTQLAWQMASPGQVEVPWARLAPAQLALSDVPPHRRKVAAQALAGVTAFLLAEADQVAPAVDWYRCAGQDIAGQPLADFRDRLARGWRFWLAPPRVAPASIEPPSEVPATQPSPEQPPWPVRLPALESLLWW